MTRYKGHLEKMDKNGCCSGFRTKSEWIIGRAKGWTSLSPENEVKKVRRAQELNPGQPKLLQRERTRKSGSLKTR